MVDHLEKIRAQFTKQADVYARMKQTTDERGLAGLVALAQTDAHHRVLDVCCGPGFLTMAFAARCVEAVGVDATELFVTRATVEAHERGLRNVQFHIGDGERLPYPGGSFDIVACRAAFHHLPRPHRVLAEMVRVARPGGRVVIADMLADEDPAKSDYHNRIERLCDPTHVRALSGPEFVRLFTDAGVELELQVGQTIDYDLEEWMAHGGPDATAAQQITALMEASVDVDRSGLRVRREGGALRFSHTAAAFLLRVQSTVKEGASDAR